MGVGERHTAIRQAVHMGSQHLRMPAQWTDPIIQIVDGDKEDIGLRNRGWLRTATEKKRG